MKAEKFFARVVRPIVALFLIYSFVFFGIGLTAPDARAQDKGAGVYEKFARPDAATRAARDKKKALWRVTLRSEADSRNLAKYGTVVGDYGSFVILAADEKANLSKLDAARIETTVNLPSGSFEPLLAPTAETLRPEDAARLAESSTGEKDYYIVQFAGATKDEWLDSLREIGAEVLQYVPHQAFFVYADSAAMAKVVNHSRVRWVGRYAAEFKISPELEKFTESRRGGTAMFDVAVFARANLEEVASRVSGSTSAKVLTVSRLPHNFFNILRVEMPVGDVSSIAQISDVVRIDQYAKPEPEDERAAQIVAGNYSSPTSIFIPPYDPLTQFGVNGAGVTVSVVDDGVSIPGNGGFYITSLNTVNGPLRGATAGANGGHGHLNASIIAGDTPFGVFDPTGYNYGKGIAPKANIINIPFLKAGNTTTDAQAIDDTLNTLGPNGVRGTISNNSWGALTNGNAYDSYAALYDGLVQDGSLNTSSFDPINIIFSAGNSGPSPLSLTRPKAAKNIIAVGNSENIRTEIGGAGADNMDDLRSTSSRGPAADGRVKPDITAPGTVITGSRAGDGSSIGGFVDANHAWSSGTSHAAPQVSGAAALFTQYWKNTHFGQYPSPSLVKAAIINTAQEMNGAGTSAKIPNGDEGWGRINLKYMLNTGVPMKYRNEDFAFVNSGETDFFTGFVADSTKPTRVTLVWTDPPAVNDPALVNNLDLLVTINGVTYRGNVFSNGFSTTGGASDTRNNVENVFLPAGIPAGTPFSVTITATAINGDGIPGNADATDQHFSVVAYNYTEQPVQPPSSSENADFDGDGRTDISVFRPNSGFWFVSNSSNNQFVAAHFGTNGDIIAPGDYDGDRKTDYAVFRPNNGHWYILPSTGGFTALQFGSNGDVPTPGDFDGDGKHDIAVYRPSIGGWYRLNSSNGQFFAAQFGTTGDLPAQGDFDGDGKTDICVFRPSEGIWYQMRSTQGFAAIVFGQAGDKPAAGDYDGDNKTDVAVFRPSSGFWYVHRSSQGFYGVNFGIATDTPAPGDFDGDGKTDVAVYRDGNWYLLRSTQGFAAFQFGIAGDRPAPNGYLPQ